MNTPALPLSLFQSYHEWHLSETDAYYKVSMENMFWIVFTHVISVAHVMHSVKHAGRWVDTRTLLSGP